MLVEKSRPNPKITKTPPLKDEYTDDDYTSSEYTVEEESPQKGKKRAWEEEAIKEANKHAF